MLATTRLAVVLSLAIVAAPATATVAAAGEISVAVQGSAVSVRADDASLRAVLAALAEKARLSLRIHGDQDRHVSVRVDGLSLEAVLDRLVPEGHVLADDRLIVFLTAPRRETTRARASAAPADGPVTVVTGPESGVSTTGEPGVVRDHGKAMNDGGVSTAVAAVPPGRPQSTPSVRRGTLFPASRTLPVAGSRATLGAPSGGVPVSPRLPVTAEVEPDEVNRLAAQVDAHLAAPTGLDAADAAATEAIARSVQLALP